MIEHQDAEKRQVHDFWNRASCGEDLYLAGGDRAAFEAQAEARYRLEPYILEFAQFEAAKGRRVLEIGVGLGADHQRFAEAGAELYGIDLTERAVAHTRSRLALFGLGSNLQTGDAEHLDFPDDAFDLVYSWGVLHHSPDTHQAIAEVHRVLKRGGGGKDHDLSHVEHGRPDALAALRLAGGADMAQPAQHLRRASGKPRHQGLLGGRVAGAFRRLQGCTDQDGADPRRSARIGRRAAAWRSGFVAGAPDMAASADSLAVSHGWVVYVD